MNYFPMRAKRVDQTCGPDWGEGEEIFLEFAVQDTGRGLTPEEKKLLFQRFSQASPRTHVQYGGSGLGLFISRELTELQGGEIGVSSEAGKGSTFAFYVKCRRSIEPKDTLEVLPASLARKVSNAKDKGKSGLTVPVQPSQPTTKTKDFATVPKQGDVTSKPIPKPKEIRVLIVEDNLGMSSEFSTSSVYLTLYSQSESPPTPAPESRHTNYRCKSRWGSARSPKIIHLLGLTTIVHQCLSLI